MAPKCYENWHHFPLLKREEIMDRLRFFTEECGALQVNLMLFMSNFNLHILLTATPLSKGFQCFADLDTGFGGFVRDFLEELRNDFPKAPVIMFGSSTSRQNMRNVSWKDDPLRKISVLMLTLIVILYSRQTKRSALLIWLWACVGCLERTVSLQASLYRHSLTSGTTLGTSAWMYV